MSSQSTQRVAQQQPYTHADFALARQTLDDVQTQYGVLSSSMGILTPRDTTAALFSQLAEIKPVFMANAEGAPLRDLCVTLMAALQPPISPVLAPAMSTPSMAVCHDVPAMLLEDPRSPLLGRKYSPLFDETQQEKTRTSPSFWARLSLKGPYTLLKNTNPDEEEC